MKHSQLKEIIKKKSSKTEFAIVTNLENGESQIFEPGKKLLGEFENFQKEVENFFKSKKNGIIENSHIFVETYIRPIKVIIIGNRTSINHKTMPLLVITISISIFH